MSFIFRYFRKDRVWVDKGPFPSAEAARIEMLEQLRNGVSVQGPFPVDDDYVAEENLVD